MVFPDGRRHAFSKAGLRQARVCWPRHKVGIVVVLPQCDQALDGGLFCCVLWVCACMCDIRMYFLPMTLRPFFRLKSCVESLSSVPPEVESGNRFVFWEYFLRYGDRVALSSSSVCVQYSRQQRSATTLHHGTMKNYNKQWSLELFYNHSTARFIETMEINASRLENHSTPVRRHILTSKDHKLSRPTCPSTMAITSTCHWCCSQLSSIESCANHIRRSFARGACPGKHSGHFQNPSTEVITDLFCPLCNFVLFRRKRLSVACTRFSWITCWW